MAGRVLGLSFALAVIAAALPVRGAHAVTFVSNVDHSPLAGFTPSALYAQSFRTGGHAAGYVVEGVRIRTAGTSSRHATSMRIRQDANGEPGAELATLPTPQSLNSSGGYQVHTFTAPDDTFLEPHTIYWISINEGVSTNQRIRYTATNGDDETGEPGWSIGDAYLHRQRGSDAWETHPTNALMFAVEGFERVPPGPELRGVPAGHDGVTPFTVELDYGLEIDPDPWNPTTNAQVARWVRTWGVRVSGGGTLESATRVVPGANRRWQLVVAPHTRSVIRSPGGITGGPSADPHDDIQIAVSATTSVNGDPIGGTRAVVVGAVKVGVRDAQAHEAPGAVLAFTVKLNQPSSERVSVKYRTRNGTAKAGSDYTERSGKLVFAPGETVKTVSVPVLDDPIDEPDEWLFLKLSRPKNAHMDRAHYEATGVIVNTDPVQSAWLARFARGAADHVFEAVRERSETGPVPGVRATFAGLALDDAGALDPDLVQRGVTSELSLTPEDVLSRSTFAAAAGTSAHGLYSVWGRGAVSRFEGREADLTVDGEVTTAMLGTDWARGPARAGLILSRSLGDGAYRAPSGAGAIDSTVTGLYPWGRYAPSERLSLWGVAGYGTGDMTVTPDGGRAMRADIDLAMVGGGLRSVLVEAPDAGGVEFAMKADALGARARSNPVPGMRAGTGRVTRLRVSLEGTRHDLVVGGGALRPRLEAALRHDGGDAETGFGVDAGGALAWTDAQGVFTVEASGRALLAHAAGGFEDYGFAAAVTFDPQPGTERGLRLSLRQSVGTPSTGGTLLALPSLAGLDAAASDPAQALEAEVAYGTGAFGGRLAATPWVALRLSGDAREYRAGWRLAGRQNAVRSFELGLEAAWDQGAGARSEPRLGVRLGARW